MESCLEKIEVNQEKAETKMKAWTNDDVVCRTPKGQTSDTAEMQQCHKRPRPETAAMTGKQGKY
jgi:hypothetical protein